VSETADLKVLFVAGFGPLIREPQASRKFYLDTLGLPLETMPHNPDYLHGEKIDGVRHFALWPLAEAAESCFGARTWPAHLPTPHSWLEFDVEDVASATRLLKERGYSVLVDNRQEPWGQTVTRLLSPEGILVGITFTPWMR
jgi:catechol 2,3-dioxygenase-like lactoylglutathione lyase family enzyme